jgi:hypothetical protein
MIAMSAYPPFSGFANHSRALRKISLLVRS